MTLFVGKQKYITLNMLHIVLSMTCNRSKTLKP